MRPRKLRLRTYTAPIKGSGNQTVYYTPVGDKITVEMPKIGRSLRRSRVKDGKLIPSEEDEHITVADWLRARRVFFIHTPNEGKRSWRTGKTLKRMGLLPGVADFLIFDPPKHCQSLVGTALELKRLDHGPTLPAEQAAFLVHLEARHWLIGWHRGADAAIRWLTELGY